MINRRAWLGDVGRMGLWGASASSWPFLSACAPWPIGSTSALPRRTPEQLGMASSAIHRFVDAVGQQGFELHGFVLMRHGQVAAEGWWKPYGPRYVHSLYSMSKSFTSTAVGLAVAEKRLSVDDRVVSFFPDDLPAQVSPNLAAMRLRDLLTMATGHETEPTWNMVRSPHWVRHFLAAPVSRPPGKHFVYSSAATYMCSAIMQKVTGQRTVDYLRPRLFDPLGIAQAHWEVSPQGIDVGGWGLYLQTESMARFGQLYLQDGRWQGQQLLPSDWVRQATAPQILTTRPAQARRPDDRNDWMQGYGYQFWRSTNDGFRGDGAYGQFTIVLPKQSAVLAIHAECRDMQGVLDLVWQHLLAGMKDEPLAADGAAHARLVDALQALSLPMPQGASRSARAREVSGRRYRLEPNPLGLDWLSPTFADESAQLVLTGPTAQHSLQVGLGAWWRGHTALPGTPPRLSPGGAPPAGTAHLYMGAGAWTSPTRFEMMMRFVETAHHDRLTLQFDADEVHLTFKGSLVAIGAQAHEERPVLRGRAAA